jgi:hypothetical protein
MARIVIGTDYFGKVDQVPECFHVGTRFFHINYIPLIPLGSMLILAKPDGGAGERGLDVALSWKSVLVAYTRAGIGVAAIALTVFTFFAFADTRHPGLGVPVLILALGGWGALWLSYRLTHASRERAQEVAEAAGLDADFPLAIGFRDEDALARIEARAAKKDETKAKRLAEKERVRTERRTKKAEETPEDEGKPKPLLKRKPRRLGV